MTGQKPGRSLRGFAKRIGEGVRNSKSSDGPATLGLLRWKNVQAFLGPSVYTWPWLHGQIKHDYIYSIIQNRFRHKIKIDIYLEYMCTLFKTHRWTTGHISSRRHGSCLNGFHLGIPVGGSALAHGDRDCRGWIARSFHLPSIRTLVLFFLPVHGNWLSSPQTLPRPRSVLDQWGYNA